MTTNINLPELKLGQGVLHDGLQTMLSNLDDKYRLTPRIEEVMKFQRGLSVKQNQKKVLENYD
jgi:hypothetical protein